MLKINLQEELKIYQGERTNLINALNQAQINMDNVRTQIIRREGIIAYLTNAIKEEAEAKKPAKKPNLKQQKANLKEQQKKEVLERAKKEVEKVEAEVGNKS